jgi:hypothetical protein
LRILAGLVGALLVIGSANAEGTKQDEPMTREQYERGMRHFQQRMELLCGPDTPERREFEKQVTDLTGNGELVRNLLKNCPRRPGAGWR